jgi:transposase
MSTDASSSFDPSLSPARVRRPDREQMMLLPASLEELLPADHAARVIWSAISAFDLARFYHPIKAREGVAGREPIDPPVLIALWLLAATEGVGSGRQLAELCAHHVAYRWLLGGLSINYHTLNDFRTGHGVALDDLLTQMLGRLMHAGLLSVNRITQDGTKVRASAGSGSFKKKPKLSEKLAEARQQVEALKQLVDEDPAEAVRRQRAASAHHAKDRVRRIEEAMKQIEQIEAAKQQQKQKPSKDRAARASLTDPDARIMKMPDGGFRPAYDVQLAQDPASRAIVGVEVTNGSDKQQSQPMRQQVHERTGQSVQEHITDGNYLTLEQIDQAQEQQVIWYVPAPEPRKKDLDRYAPRAGDSPAVAQWRARMASEAAQAIYKQRSKTCETVNADFKEHRGLRQVNVRGLGKVLCVALWTALAYNVMHFASAMT